jgi:flavin-dependent thymidylate synthase
LLKLVAETPNTRSIEMKVELIDYTGCGHADPADYAAKLLIYTKNTRLEQNATTRLSINGWPPERIKEELEYISKTIRSSWEFVDYTFQITGVSRAFTHQFVRTRTGSYAQQSQRSVDLSSGFEVLTPQSVTGDPDRKRVWEAGMSAVWRAYAELRKLGVPTEDARGVIPTNVSTNIIAKFNLRTLADLAGKRDNLRAQGEYADVYGHMASLVQKAHPWTSDFLYPVRARTPALDAILREVLGDATPASKPEVNNALKELDALKAVWG